MTDQEPEVDVCCQEFDKCLRSCTPRGQWIARNEVKEWKGLSTAEVKVLWNLTKKPSEFAKMIETKLKEKNHGRQDD